MVFLCGIVLIKKSLKIWQKDKSIYNKQYSILYNKLIKMAVEEISEVEGVQETEGTEATDKRN